MTDQFGVSLDDLCNALSCECFLTESPLDIVQDLGVSGVVFVENVLQLQVRRTETVAEMLRKDPPAVCVSMILRAGESTHRGEVAHKHKWLPGQHDFPVI